MWVEAISKGTVQAAEVSPQHAVRFMNVLSESADVPYAPEAIAEASPQGYFR